MYNSPAPRDAEYRLSTSRRKLFGFGLALLAAPSIVRVASIMPVSVPKPTLGKLLSANWDIIVHWPAPIIDMEHVFAEIARTHDISYMLRDPQGMRVA